MSMKNTPKVECNGKSRTKQCFRERADINGIIARYRKSGSFDYVSKRAPIFADVTGIGDFASVVRKVHAAEEAFNELPSKLRARFHNDASQLIAFVQDAGNRKEAIELGLIEAPVVEEPSAAPVEGGGDPTPSGAPDGAPAA